MSDLVSRLLEWTHVSTTARLASSQPSGSDGILEAGTAKVRPKPDVIGEEPRFNLPNGDPQFSKFHLFLVQRVQELAGARSVMIEVA